MRGQREKEKEREASAMRNCSAGHVRWSLSQSVEEGGAGHGTMTRCAPSGRASGPRQVGVGKENGGGGRMSWTPGEVGQSTTEDHGTPKGNRGGTPSLKSVGLGLGLGAGAMLGLPLQPAEANSIRSDLLQFDLTRPAATYCNHNQQNSTSIYLAAVLE